MEDKRKARETALQVLYNIDIAGNWGGPHAFDVLVEGLEQGSKARAYCDTLVSGVTTRRDSLDAIIEKSAENWTIERMAIVDRNVLRIAAYELLYQPEVPYKVVIDEAVELAKQYGSEESGAFINGILDHLRVSVPAHQPAGSD